MEGSGSGIFYTPPHNVLRWTEENRNKHI